MKKKSKFWLGVGIKFATISSMALNSLCHLYCVFVWSRDASIDNLQKILTSAPKSAKAAMSNVQPRLNSSYKNTQAHSPHWYENALPLLMNGKELYW